MIQPNGSTLTSDEVSNLVRLIPQKKPSFPSTARLLQPILDVLSPKWVRDFIFTPAPIHVPHLTSPSLPVSALACVTEFASVERNSARPYRLIAQNESCTSRGYALFVPAFTANHTTVGVGVWHSLATGLPLARRPSGLVQLNFRFARDARTRTLVYVIHCPEDYMYHVCAARIKSSTLVQDFRSFFHESLQDVALGCEQELRVKDVLPKLLLVQNELREHACTHCSAPTEPGCSCETREDSPVHPFDFECFKRGMAHHTGTSRAMASRMFFDRGKPFNHTVLGVRSSLKGIVDINIVRSMSTWSILEHMKTVKQDPLQSLLLTLPGDDINSPRMGIPGVQSGQNAHNQTNLYENANLNTSHRILSHEIRTTCPEEAEDPKFHNLHSSLHIQTAPECVSNSMEGPICQNENCDHLQCLALGSLRHSSHKPESSSGVIQAPLFEAESYRPFDGAAAYPCDGFSEHQFRQRPESAARSQEPAEWEEVDGNEQELVQQRLELELEASRERLSTLRRKETDLQIANMSLREALARNFL